MSLFPTTAPRASRRIHLLGLTWLAMGAGLGLAVFTWLSTDSGLRASVLAPTTGSVVAAPRPAVGLIERSDNRGQVLFGRYCDSCHTAGLEGLGPSLRDTQFKRQYTTDEKIIRFVRAGGFDMPAYSEDLLSDQDVALIAAYVTGLPQETR